MKRQVHLAKVEEVAILVAEGRSLSETIEIAQSLARKIVQSRCEHGDPLEIRVLS